jgi:hypothetical protein
MQKTSDLMVCLEMYFLSLVKQKLCTKEMFLGFLTFWVRLVGFNL